MPLCREAAFQNSPCDNGEGYGNTKVERNRDKRQASYEIRPSPVLELFPNDIGKRNPVRPGLRSQRVRNEKADRKGDDGRNEPEDVAKHAPVRLATKSELGNDRQAET